MKYKLFCGCRCYPVGGYDDFEGNFSSIEEAQKFFKTTLDEWAHIVVNDEIILWGYFNSGSKINKWTWESKPLD